MKKPLIHLARAAAVSALGLIISVVLAAAQSTPPTPPPAGPPPPQNLQFFPKDMPRSEVISIMRQFCFALGTNCAHCHVDEDEGPNPRKDFALDEKPAKIKARAMLQMTKQINDELLTRISDRTMPEPAVTCATCHHGSPLPRTLAAHLGVAATAGGPDSAVAELRHLRDDAEFGRFDVSEWGVTEAAKTLSAGGRRTEALAVLNANAGYHPESNAIPAVIAEIHVADGDTAAAVEILKGLVTADPENRRVKAMLDRLTGKGQKGGH